MLDALFSSRSLTCSKLRYLVMNKIILLVIFTLVLPRLGHAATELVSSRKPEGLILSTGNVYFTSHDATSASVWRTAQSSSPGQEIRLYREKGARFGDIVFAQVDGNWWGYFFADGTGG